jgi:hypothetical protein
MRVIKSMRGNPQGAKRSTIYYPVHTSLHRVGDDSLPVNTILTMDILDEINSSLESLVLDLLLNDD